MSEPSSEDDDFPVDTPEKQRRAPQSWDDTQSPVEPGSESGRAAQPCAVYPGGPETMGRVTTPAGDLGFTNLFGATGEMMRQLGRRSATDLRDGALSYLAQFGVDVVDALVPKPMVGLGRWALENWLLQRLRDNMPAEYMEALRAYGEASGHQVEQVVAGQLGWDIWALLGRAPSKRVRRAAGCARRHSPLLGSASVILPTGDIGPLHLRWLDNTAVDRWERKASVAFFHPDRGISYVFASSIGYPTGLPAGMNAAGLTLTVEPGRGTEIDWSGAPLGRAAHEILRQAHTIEEAAALLRQWPSMASWRYVLCEGDTGRAAVFETASEVERVQSGGGSPFCVTAAQGEFPGQQIARIARWHRARRRALDRITNQWSCPGEDAVYRALKAMAQPVVERVAVPGHPLGGLSNVGAVVFEPANRRLWIAAGRAPVCRRWFVPLTLRAADGEGRGGLDRRVRPIKPGDDWESSNPGRAMEHLRHALQLDRSGERPQRILITLEHALALDAGRPSLHILAGLMALRAGRGRRATGAFKKALDLVDDPTRRAEVGVYLAWSLDLQKRRLAARRLYRRLSREPDVEVEVRRWARRGRRRRFRQRHARTLHIDYFLATVFQT